MRSLELRLLARCPPSDRSWPCDSHFLPMHIPQHATTLHRRMLCPPQHRDVVFTDRSRRLHLQKSFARFDPASATLADHSTTAPGLRGPSLLDTRLGSRWDVVSTHEFSPSHHIAKFFGLSHSIRADITEAQSQRATQIHHSKAYWQPFLLVPGSIPAVPAKLPH